MKGLRNSDYPDPWNIPPVNPEWNVFKEGVVVEIRDEPYDLNDLNELALELFEFAAQDDPVHANDLMREAACVVSDFYKVLKARSEVYEG